MLANGTELDFSENNGERKNWKKLKNVNVEVVCVDFCTDKTVHARETNDGAETENRIRGLVSAKWRRCFTGSEYAQMSFACEEIRPEHRPPARKNPERSLTMSGLIRLKWMSKIHQDGALP